MINKLFLKHSYCYTCHEDIKNCECQISEQVLKPRQFDNALKEYNDSIKNDDGGLNRNKRDDSKTRTDLIPLLKKRTQQILSDEVFIKESDLLKHLLIFKKRLTKELDICPNQIFSIMDEVIGVTKDE